MELLKKGDEDKEDGSLYCCILTINQKSCAMPPNSIVSKDNLGGGVLIRNVMIVRRCCDIM